MSKPNISTEKLSSWDEYNEKQPAEALDLIYTHAQANSQKVCSWYWRSIGVKRRTSQVVRIIAVLLLILGTTSPLVAAIRETAQDKLLFTQLGLGALAIAGLLQLADKVFGWSSGWMRYITTVTTMENLTRVFQLEWGKYLISKSGPLSAVDVKALYDLAQKLEQELAKLQEEETTKWIAEFNTGISLLDTLIKTQREETNKKLDAIRTSIGTQQAEEKAKLPGALEVTIRHKDAPKNITIALDDETPVDFLGPVWARLEVSAGRHLLRVRTSSEPPQKIERVVEIKPDTTTKEEISVT